VTVSAQTPYNPYVGNGVTTVFPYQFKILDEADIAVYVDGVLKTLGVDYTVSGVGADTGGDITFLAAPGNTLSVSLVREMEVVRSTDYQQQGDFNAGTVNPDFDRAILLLQDVQTQLGRSIRTPADEVGTIPTLPSIDDRAGLFMGFDANGQPIPLSGTGNDAALRVDLAKTTVGSDGSRLVGYRRSEAGSVAAAVADVLRRRIWLEDFSGADYTGASNSDLAFTNAFAALGGRGTIILSKGTLRLGAQLVVPAGVTLVGQGRSSDAGTSGATRIRRNFAGALATILLSGDDSGLDLIDIDQNNQGTGEAVQVTGSRVNIGRLSVANSGGRAVWVGAAEAAHTINANLWRIDSLYCLDCVGSALYVHNSSTPPVPDTTQTSATTNLSTAVTLAAPNANIRRGQFVSGATIAAGTRVASVSGTALVLDTAATGTNGATLLTFETWPNGIPDVNAGTLVHMDAIRCGDGLVVENAIDCAFYSVTAQDCTGKGWWFKRYARGHMLHKVYTEGNATEGQLDSGASKNTIRGNRFTLTNSGWVINDVDNDIEQFDNGMEGLSPSYRMNRQTIFSPAAGGEATIDLHAESGRAMYAQLAGKKDSGAGGKAILRTRSTAGVITDRITVDQAGLAYHRNGNAVLIGKSAVDTTTTGLTLWSDGFGAGRIDYVNSGAGSKVVCSFYDATGAGGAGNITTNGAGATAFNTSSDARRKEHLTFDLGDARFDDIQIHRFRWKDSGKEDVGVFAQELQAVYPLAVTHIEAHEIVCQQEHEDGKVEVHVHQQPEFWGVDYAKLVPLLVFELQALKKRVAELEGAR
jgi:hypothetical protein